MPNCDFYAVGQDFGDVLGIVFNQMDCKVFEASSPVGREPAELRSAEEVYARYSIGDCLQGHSSVSLQLLPEGADGIIKILRSEVAAEPSPATLHNKLFGWGLIRLELGGTYAAGIVASHTNHISQRKAKLVENHFPELGEVSSWNWQEVTNFSHRLNGYIWRLAFTEEGSRPILPEAARFIHGSMVIRYQRPSNDNYISL
jgi:hypothetical protein